MPEAAADGFDVDVLSDQQRCLRVPEHVWGQAGVLCTSSVPLSVSLNVVRDFSELPKAIVRAPFAEPSRKAVWVHVRDGDWPPLSFFVIFSFSPRVSLGID